jgi:hypothetical protein
MNQICELFFSSTGLSNKQDVFIVLRVNVCFAQYAKKFFVLSYDA